MKRALVNTLCELMSKRDDLFVLIGDLGYGVMNPIQENYPQKIINMGICEQNMASVAAGMAMEGNVVFIYSIGNFPTLRCIEQIRNDIAYHNANVKIISVGAGFAYGNLGMSHHATEDIAMMRTIPNMTVISPSDPNETVEAVKMAVKTNGPVYIRLGRGGEENLTKHTSFNKNKFIELLQGEKIALLATGIITKEALIAAESLEKVGIKPSVYSVPVIKPIDVDFLKQLIMDYDCIVTIEEHSTEGGFGSVVAEVASSFSNNTKILRIGMENQFTTIVGSPEYLRHYYKIDNEGIVMRILNELKG